MTDTRDYIYSAIRMASKVDYKAIRELMGKGIISGYRELAEFERFRDTDRIEVSDLTRQKLNTMNNSVRKILELADGYRKLSEDNKIFTVSSEDDDYPPHWRHLAGMPNVIYARGSRKLLAGMINRGSAAVVGSREASRYSMFATDSFCSELSRKGIVIVSGMALGIDSQAHRSALHRSGGTVAVLAGGPDICYPPGNRDIYDMMTDGGNGLVVSEMPPGQTVLRQYFPARNRLIAGLGDCVMIMEAGEVSGTLHTASFAAAQGKEVFVLPNSIYFDNARGGLKLLEDGCHILISTDGVIDAVAQALIYRRLDNPELMLPQERSPDGNDMRLGMIELRKKARASPEEISDIEWQKIIADELTVMPRNADELCNALELPFYRVSKLLVDMQMSGTLKQKGGKYELIKQ